jgi:preprotein translocase subunit SecE
MLDKVKLVVAVLLLVGGFVGFYYFASYEGTLLYRVLGLLAILGAAIAIGVTTQPGAQLVSFGRAATLEMRKSVWPTRRETTQTTLVVLAMVTVVGLMIFIIDSILRWVIKSLF